MAIKSLFNQTVSKLAIMNSKVSRYVVLQPSAVASVVVIAASQSFFKLQKPNKCDYNVKRVTCQKKEASAIGSATT